VYADIAQMEKYSLLGKTYDDLADTSLLVTEPSIFQDFWYSCVVSGALGRKTVEFRYDMLI
jgi:hypothetical protein